MLKEVKNTVTAQADGNEHAKELGAVIHRARTQLGLSKAEAARRAQVATSTWQLLEAGETSNPTDSTLGRIARVLSINPDDLLRIVGRSSQTSLSATVQRIASATAMSDDDSFYLAIERNTRLTPAAKRFLLDAYRFAVDTSR